MGAFKTGVGTSGGTVTGPHDMRLPETFEERALLLKILDNYDVYNEQEGESGEGRD